MSNLTLDGGQAKFDRSDTKAVKGVAVVLMLFHHLAGFSERFPVGFAGFRSIWQVLVDSGYLEQLAYAAKFCVAIFFFLGGYGLYIRLSKGTFSVKKAIFDLYRAYWKVFVILIPIGFLFFARSGDGINALATRFTVKGIGTTVTTVVSDLIGFTSLLNGEWWFFASYVCALPMGYLFCCATKKLNNFWAELFIVFGLDILFRAFFPTLDNGFFAFLSENVYYSRFLTINGYVSTFFAGIVFAKYDGICEVKRMIRSLPCGTLLSFVGLGVLYWSRSFVESENLDIVYCALMIPMLSVIFDKLRFLKSGFGFLGKHSTNMWLIHSFYCYYFLEITRIVYCTPSVWVDLLILISLSLVSSILLNAFYTALGRVIAYFKKNKKTYIKEI